MRQEGKATAPDPVFLDHYDCACEVGAGQRAQRPLDKFPRLLLIVISPADEDHAGFIGMRESQKPWIVKVRGENNAMFFAGIAEQNRIGSASEAGL